MGIKVVSLVWVMQDLYHPPHGRILNRSFLVKGFWKVWGFLWLRAWDAALAAGNLPF